MAAKKEENEEEESGDDSFEQVVRSLVLLPSAQEADAEPSS